VVDLPREVKFCKSHIGLDDGLGPNLVVLVVFDQPHCFSLLGMGSCVLLLPSGKIVLYDRRISIEQKTSKK